MPLTPETWLNEFQVNNTTTTSDFDGQIVQLANGNILVAWTTWNATDGYDVIGQIYDPFGSEVGGEIALSDTPLNTNDQPAIAPLPDGGWLVTYERTSGSYNDIRLVQYSPTGTVEATGYPFFDSDSTGAPDGYTPEVAVSSSTSALFVWRETEDNGDSQIMGRIWNPATETWAGASFGLIAYTGEHYTPDVAVLNNGNYVIVDRHDNSGDGRIVMRIVSDTGANVRSVTVVGSTGSNGDNDYEPSVTALTGGGFAIAWTNTEPGVDTDVFVQVFNAGGTATTGVLTVNGGAITDSNNEPVVVALADGGFMVIYDDDEDGGIVAQRYSSTGATVGSPYAITTLNTGYTSVDAELLADGRVAVTFSNPSGNIAMEIIDTRDNATEGDVLGADYWVGTIGNDSFTVTSGTGDVHGWSGNDYITEAGAVRDYYGDSGNDTIRVVSAINSDRHDGGSGTDRIDWSLATGVSGATFNLGAGTATQGGQTEVMVNFEQLIGTINNDTIYGRNGSDTLWGGDGNDVMYSGGDNDVLYGQNGNDYMYSDLGNETMNGGSGIDTINHAAFSGSYVFNMATGLTNYTGESYTNFERAFMGAGNDSVTGNASANIIWGNNGNDTIHGGAGADTSYGGSGNDVMYSEGDGDRVYGQGGNDTLHSGIGSETMDGGSGTDVIDHTAYNGNYLFNMATGLTNFGGESYTNFETAIMGNGSDTVTGNASDNLIEGNGGNDNLSGMDGADTLDGGAGNDTLSGGNQNDVLLGGDGNDEMSGGAGADSMEGGTGHDLMVGGNRGDTIKGGGGNDTIGAGNGDDVVDGGAGYDLVRGGDGDDFILGGNLDDTVLGGTGSDTLLGSSGNDTIKGRGGFDIIEGGSGDDLLTGGAQADQFVFTNGWGNDVITDFNATNNAEDIDLSGVSAIVNFTDLMNNHISQVGADVYIDDNLGNTIRLIGVNLGDLNAADFDF